MLEENEILIDPDLVKKVIASPVLFPETVMMLAGVKTEYEHRTPDEIAMMRLCRNALCAKVSERRQYIEDMVHNATANVRTPKVPYFPV